MITKQQLQTEIESLRRQKAQALSTADMATGAIQAFESLLSKAEDEKPNEVPGEQAG